MKQSALPFFSGVSPGAGALRTVWYYGSGLFGLVVFLCLLFAGTCLATASRPPATASSVAAPAAQNDFRLSIKTVAVVTRDRVLLGDIALPAGNIPEAQWQELAAMPLWAAPEQQGRAFAISRNKLEKLLEQYMGDMAFLCILKGQLVIQRGGRIADQLELEKGMRAGLESRLHRLEGEVSLRDYRLPEYVLLSDTHNTLRYKVPDTVRAGRVTLSIQEVAPNGYIVRKYTASTFIDQWITVPCATRAISTREALVPTSVTFKRKNAALLRGRLWQANFFGMRARRSIAAGEVLYDDFFEELPVISKGDIVDLVFQGRFVRLSVEAKALSDGRGGERIVVRNLQSKREISARVVDAGLVMVQ